MAENPAVSINGGYDADGFPIGVQIVGRRFDDLGVLAMAKAFEAHARPAKAVAGDAKELKDPVITASSCPASCQAASTSLTRDREI